MPRMPVRRCSRISVGFFTTLAVSWSGLAWAEEGFEDCGIINYSLVSPFVQGRAQLSILNLANSDGTLCNLVEFRIAELAKAAIEREVDGVGRKWWKEHWGVYRCGEPVIYDVWFQEIGIGGVTFSSELLEDPDEALLTRLEAGTPLQPEPALAEAERVKAEEENGEPEPDYLAIAKAAIAAAKPPGAEEPDYLAIARAAIAGEDVPEEPAVGEDIAPDNVAVAEASAAAQQIQKEDKSSKPAPPPAEAPAARRDLSFKSPNLKGHDVCAVQRALIAEGIPVTVDGLYGPGVKKAVAKFQKTHGLESDGVVNDETRRALAYGPQPTKKDAE